MSTLVAGPVAWGAIGYGVGAVTGVSAFLPIGIVIGFAASLWLVFHRYTQGLSTSSGLPYEPPARPTATSDGHDSIVDQRPAAEGRADRGDSR